MFEHSRLQSVKWHLFFLIMCNEASGYMLLPILPTRFPARRNMLLRTRSMIPGCSPFESDGMLVYGQPTTPDGRVEVQSKSLAQALQRAGAPSHEAEASTKGEKDIAPATPSEGFDLGGHALKPRTVLVGSPDKGLNLTIWEVAAPQEMLEEWMYRDSSDTGPSSSSSSSSSSAPLVSAATPDERCGADDLDPFGVVLWPGAQLTAARLLGQQAAGEVASQEAAASGRNTEYQYSSLESSLQEKSRISLQGGNGGRGGAQQWAGKRILCVGCGTGLEALAASIGGGASVVATDTNPLPLALLRLAAANCAEWQPNKNDDTSGVSSSSGSRSSSGTLRTAFFDILNPANPAPEVRNESEDSLTYGGPIFGASLDEDSETSTWGQGGGEDLLSSCDLLVAADCLYNKELAEALAERCLTAWARGAAVLVADSQGFHRADFETAIDRGWTQAAAARATLLEKAKNSGASLSGEGINMRTLENYMRPALESVSMRVVGSGLLLEGDLDYTITVKLLSLPGMIHDS